MGSCNTDINNQNDTKCTHPPELALLAALCVFLYLWPQPLTQPSIIPPAWGGGGLNNTSAPWEACENARWQFCSEADGTASSGWRPGMLLNILTKRGTGTYNKELLSPTINNAEVEKPYSRRKAHGWWLQWVMYLTQEAHRSFPNWDHKPDIVVNKGQAGRCICRIAYCWVLEWPCFMPGRDVGSCTP